MKVTKSTPVEVSGIRDPGMRALVVLAASLGWNVHQRINSPVVLTSRDGTQLRIPTNTSIRISVFQSRLSGILLHAEEPEPTPELIEAIIKSEKVDRDHARRLRLAIGVTPEEHKARLATETAKSKREPEPLTQRLTIESPEVWVDTIEEAIMLPEEWREPATPSEVVEVSREPTIGRKSGDKLYESTASLTVTYSDGSVRYECVTCGKQFEQKRALGGHRTWHMARGDVPRGTRDIGQAEVIGRDPDYVAPRRVQVREEPTIEERFEEVAQIMEPSGAEDKLEAIRLILGDPGLQARIDELETENNDLRLRVEQTESNLKALRDLLEGL